MQVHVIAAGKYHDIDFARLELLKLLAEIQEVRTSVATNYGDMERLVDCKLLITYTCDLIPNEAEVEALRKFLEAGGRWLALHGTNSILRFDAGGLVTTPDDAPQFMALLGTRFLAHPPITPFDVHISGDHPLTAGLRDFSVSDELYLTERTGEIDVLMHSHFDGRACPDFAKSRHEAQKVPILYLRSLGKGAVLYCTLGHCRSHHDLRPLVDFWPHPERCSWDYPVFSEILRRAIRWGVRDRTYRASEAGRTGSRQGDRRAGSEASLAGSNSKIGP